MSAINYKIADSISKIKKEDWDDIFGDIHEGYAFYKTLEESGFGEFSFHYILLYEGSKLLLIAPAFITDFYADDILQERIARPIAAARKILPKLLVFKTLFCGSPFGENGILGIRREVADKQNILHELVRVLNIFCRGKKISLIIFKDFPPEDAGLLGCLQLRGFFKADSFPTAVIDLNFNSFDEYLGSLSHATRKSLRRKIKKARAQGNITTKIVGRIDDELDDIYRLYLNTHAAGKTKFEKLTRDFFLRIAENFGAGCKYFLYYVDGRLAAFNLCLVHGDLLIDKFIGFDYEIAHQYNLYFISWCYNIEWCLENSIHHYQVGQTDYAPKIQLGGKLIPLYAYVKHTNSAVNMLTKILSKFLNI